MADEPLELSELRTALEQQGQPWTAGETSMSRMPVQDQKLRLGVEPPPGELTLDELDEAVQAGEALTAIEAAESFGAPVAFDLRNVGGKNYVTPIKNQGGCGSCVAFGTAAVLETTSKFNQRDATTNLDLSEAHFFYCYARSEGRTCANGWWPENALNHAKASGVTFEEFYPYTAGDQNCTGLNANWKQKHAKVTAFHKLTSVAEMKQWISTRGPVTGCFAVYQDFMNYRSGVYRYVSGQQLGGHCVAIIGYDDNQQAWICKNSWGSGWGEGGFFRIGYGQCGIETWAGPFAVDGVSLNLWRNNETVNGLWTNNAHRNAYVHLTGSGWKKVAADSEQVHATMLAQLITAKASSRPINSYEEAGVIRELYVL